MLKDLKQILISANQEIIEIENRKRKLENELWDENNGLLGKRGNIHNQILRQKKYIFSFFNKRKIEDLEAEYENLVQQCDNLEKGLGELEKKEKMFLDIVNRKLRTIEEAEQEIKRIRQATSLEELGISIEEATKIFNIVGKDFVLDESDKLPKGTTQKGGGGIAFTHLTDYMPEDGEIKRMIDKGAKKIIEGEWGKIEVVSSRETTHLAACSEVDNADLFSWDDKKIGIIIPLSILPKDLNVTSYNPADFQIKDKVKIDGGYIICPKDMVSEAKQKNPNVNVIGYEGDNVRGLINQALIYFGYSYDMVGNYGFVNEHVGQFYKRQIEKYFEITDPPMSPHSNTIEKRSEVKGRVFNVLNAFKDGIKNGTVHYNGNENEILKIIMANISALKLDELQEVFMKLTNSDQKGSTFSDEEIKEALRQNVAQILRECELQCRHSTLTDNLGETYLNEGITPDDVREAGANVKAAVPNKNERKDTYVQ